MINKELTKVKINSTEDILIEVPSIENESKNTNVGTSKIQNFNYKINNNFSPQLAYDAGITYKPSKNSYIHLNFQKLPKLGIVNGLNNRVFMNNHFNNSNFLPN